MLVTGTQWQSSNSNQRIHSHQKHNKPCSFGSFIQSVTHTMPTKYIIVFGFATYISLHWILLSEREYMCIPAERKLKKDFRLKMIVTMRHKFCRKNTTPNGILSIFIHFNHTNESDKISSKSQKTKNYFQFLIYSIHSQMCLIGPQKCTKKK